MGLPNVRAAVCRARLFHRPAIDPRAILSLSLSANGLLTTYYYANNRSRIKQIVSHWVPS